MAITKERAIEVIESLYQNLSISKALKSNKVQAKDFYHHVDKDPEIGELYALTKRHVSEVFINEIIDIADSEGDPHKAKNRIHARQWLAAKLNPKIYGEKLGLEIDTGPNLKIAMEAAALRFQKMRHTQEIDASDPLKPKQIIARAVDLNESDEVQLFSNLKEVILDNGQIVYTSHETTKAKTGSQPVDVKLNDTNDKRD